jgi:hypothetical protein
VRYDGATVTKFGVVYALAEKGLMRYTDSDEEAGNVHEGFWTQKRS